MPKICPSTVIVISPTSRFPRPQAKIDDVRLAVAIDQDIARLDVAMNDPLLVSVLQGVGDLDHHLGGVAGVSRGAEPFVRSAPSMKSLTM